MSKLSFCCFHGEKEVLFTKNAGISRQLVLVQNAYYREHLLLSYMQIVNSYLLTRTQVPGLVLDMNVNVA